MTHAAVRFRTRWMLVTFAALTPVLVFARPASALCLAQTEAQAFRRAAVVFEGLMLPGPTVEMGDLGAVLSSNARVHVERYRKGEGPPTVRIPTAVSGRDSAARVGDDETGPVPAPLVFTEDGIAPTAGERWVIYGDLRSDGSVRTSTCAGSHRLGEPGPFMEPSVIDLIRDEQLGWVAAATLTAAAALFVHHRSSQAGARAGDGA